MERRHACVDSLSGGATAQFHYQQHSDSGQIDLRWLNLSH